MKLWHFVLLFAACVALVIVRRALSSPPVVENPKPEPVELKL